MARPLFIDADLDLSVDGHPVHVRGEGRRVTVEVDRAQTAWRLFRSNRPAPEAVQTVTDLLREHDVDLHIEVGGRPWGQIGATAEPGPLSRAIGVPVEIHRPAVPRRVFWLAVGAIALGGLALALRQRGNG